MYVLYTRHEISNGKGKWPDIITEYMTELPPIIDLSKNINDALVLDEQWAAELSYLTGFEMKELRR